MKWRRTSTTRRARGYTPTLHRKEGDAGNAAYWYRRAGQPIARGPLDDEREAIVTALLSRRADLEGTDFVPTHVTPLVVTGGYWTVSSSMSNTSAALGGIGPLPLEP